MKKNGTETKAPNRESRVKSKQTQTPKGGNSKGKSRGKGKEKEIVPKLYASLTIIGVRLAPMLISLTMVLTTILSIFDLYYPFFDAFFGMSYIGLACLYVLSKTYRFCLYHRLFIYHAAFFNTIIYADEIKPIPIEPFDFLVGLLVMSAVFFAGALWAHMKYGDREAPKK